MAVEAPLSKFTKDNYRIGIAVMLALMIWFAYDGYVSKSFYQKHVVDKGGKPDATMIFNRYSPPAFGILAALLGVRLAMIRGRKITAGDDALVLEDGKTIPYDRIEQIDKTHFQSKSYFVLTYKTDGGAETDLKLSGRVYDNVPAILEILTAKITGQQPGGERLKEGSAGQ